MRIAAILLLCVLLSACQSPSTAETMAISPAAVATPTITTTAQTANATAKPTATPGATPAPIEDMDAFERIVEIKLRDELDWAIPGRESIRAELWHVWIEDESIGFYDSYLHLKLWGEGAYGTYRLSDEGSMPPYYLYPCNVTGSRRDLLVSKATTSNGIEIWTYDLLSLNDKNELVSVSSYEENFPYPMIPVRKESTRDRVKIYADATELNDEILLIDWPTPIDPMGWVGGGVYYLEEGKSIAELLRHQEIVPEDIDGDGKDELRLQFFLGDYKAWYGHVTAWMSYEDGAWETVKVLLAAFDEDEYLRSPSSAISAREIITPLVMTDEDALTTDDPAQFEVNGLRVGSPVWEMYERLGDPFDLFSYTCRYAVDDGTMLLIEMEANRIARFTLARP